MLLDKKLQEYLLLFHQTKPSYLRPILELPCLLGLTESTGRLSAFAVISQIAGSLATLFATTTEVGESLVAAGFGLALQQHRPWCSTGLLG